MIQPDMRAFAAGNLYRRLITHHRIETGRVISALTHFVDGAADYQAGSAFTFWLYIRGASETVTISALHDVTGTGSAAAFARYAATEPRISSSLRFDSHLNTTIELKFEKGFR